MTGWMCRHRGIAAVLLALCAPAATARAPQVDWGERLLVASGNARQGPWRMNRSEFHYVDDPAVAVGPDGTTTLVWVDQSRKDVFLQRYGPAGDPLLARPVNVSRSGKIFSWLPRVVTAGRDPAAIYVLWQEIIFSGGSHGGDILFARSLDGGRSFEAPANLSRDRAGSGKGRLTEERWHNGSLDLSLAGDGGLLAAWTDYEGSLWLSRSADRGGTFEEPVQIVAAGTAPPARAPSLATAPREVVHLAWTVGESPTADIRLVSSTDGGRTFTEPRVARSTAGRSDAPDIVVDGAGTLHLFHGEHHQDDAGGGHVAYTRRGVGEDAFTKPVNVSQRQSAQHHGAGFPSAARGREGELYVLWELFPRAGQAPRGLGYALSGDGGETWTSPGVVPGSRDPGQGINGSLQGLLMEKLAANEQGAIAVVNSTFRRNEASHVWLLRGRHPMEERAAGSRSALGREGGARNPAD